MVKKHLFSMREAENYLGVSRMTLLDAEDKNLISPERTQGGHRRYTVEMLEQLLKANRSDCEERANLTQGQRSFQLSQFLAQLDDNHTSFQEQLDDALRNLVLLLQVEAGAVYLQDSGNQLLLRSSYGIPYWVTAEAQYIKPGGISEKVVQQRKSAVYNGAKSEIPLRLEVRQGICVPLIYLDQVLGVVHILSTHRSQFFPSEINIATTIAVYLASLVVNSQLLAQQQTLVQELSLLNRISRAMETRTQLDPALQTFLEETLAVMDANAGAVFLLDPEGERLYVRAQIGFPKAMSTFSLKVGEGVTGWVVANSQAHISPHLSEDPLFSQRADFLTEQTISNICLPLRTAGETFGAFQISRKDGGAFCDDDEHFLSTLGSQAAVIIRRVLVMEEADRRARSEHILRDYYQTVVENLPVGMIVIDRQDKVKLWNDAMVRMTGLDRDTVLEGHPDEVFPRMEICWRVAREVIENGQPRLYPRLKHMTPRGELGICEARFVPIKGERDSTEAVVLYLHEIS